MSDGKIKVSWDDIRSAEAEPMATPNQPAADSSPAHFRRRIQKWGIMLGGLGAVVALGIAVMVFSARGKSLPMDELRLASLTVYGGWSENGKLDHDSDAWAGSAFPVEEYMAESHKYLRLVTNAHCLGLDGRKARKEYVLLLRTQTGKIQRVERMAVAQRKVDLALLDVRADEWMRGRDYVIVPYSRQPRLREGQTVVAIGNPLGYLPGSQTRGTISAIREDPQGQRVIQHDAAVNHGNSGGPLFLLRGDRAYWIAVNTFVIRADETVGLNFAIPADDVMASEYTWVDADLGGARHLASD